jgi:2-methylcitrate dehydratase
VDRISRQLVDYALAWRLDPAPGPVTDATLLHLADTVACAIAGIESEPGRIVEEVARRQPLDGGATVVGSGTRTTPELAAFANTVLVRTFDWNDGMLAKGGGHPSDMIPALLAVGETRHVPGAQVMAAITLAYELLGALGDAVPNRDRGWDQGTFMGTAAALALGRLIGLDENRLGHALSLALVPAMPLRVSRTGSLSMWKGGATAAAVKHAVFATTLAEAGMTGPDRPFEGKQGFFDQVSDGPFELSLPAFPGGLAVVQLSHMKRFPAETHSQPIVERLIEIRAATPIDAIEAIEVETYWQAYHEIGMDPSKWAPETRETADHSLPYLMAVALEDGDIRLGSFTDERIRQASTRALMARITVREEPSFTAAYRPKGESISSMPRSRLTVRLRDGSTRIEDVGFARGHAKNPMTRADVDDKFETVAGDWLHPEHLAAIRQAWWGVVQAPDIGGPIRLLTGISPRRSID